MPLLESLDRFGSPDLSNLREKIGATLSATQRLRPQIDEAVSFRWASPDEVLAKSWSDEVTRLMVETDELWMGFVKNFTDYRSERNPAL